MLFHIISKEFYDKYNKMAEEKGISLVGFNSKYLQKDYLIKAYLEDEHLNNIPLKYWDSLIFTYNMFNPHKKIKYLYEGVCLYKFLAKKELLGVKFIIREKPIKVKDLFDKTGEFNKYFEGRRIKINYLENEGDYYGEVIGKKATIVKPFPYEDDLSFTIGVEVDISERYFRKLNLVDDDEIIFI